MQAALARLSSCNAFPQCHINQDYYMEDSGNYLQRFSCLASDRKLTDWLKDGRFRHGFENCVILSA